MGVPKTQLKNFNFAIHASFVLMFWDGKVLNKNPYSSVKLILVEGKLIEATNQISISMKKHTFDIVAYKINGKL